MNMPLQTQEFIRKYFINDGILNIFLDVVFSSSFKEEEKMSYTLFCFVHAMEIP